MATVDGARACGLDDRIGTLEVGKQADVLMLRADTPNLAPMSDPVAAVVHSAGTHNVDSVYVAGRLVKRKGTFVDIDVRSVIAQATASHDYLLGAPRRGRPELVPAITTDLNPARRRGHLPAPNPRSTAHSTQGRQRWSRPGARCRHCCWSVSPGRSPNPACDSHRTGLSMVSAVGWFRQPGPRGWGSGCPGSGTA